jgi:hypothetical protein
MHREVSALQRDAIACFVRLQQNFDVFHNSEVTRSPAQQTHCFQRRTYRVTIGVIFPVITRLLKDWFARETRHLCCSQKNLTMHISNVQW